MTSRSCCSSANVSLTPAIIVPGATKIEEASECHGNIKSFARFVTTKLGSCLNITRSGVDPRKHIRD